VAADVRGLRRTIEALSADIVARDRKIAALEKSVATMNATVAEVETIKKQMAGLTRPPRARKK